MVCRVVLLALLMLFGLAAGGLAQNAQPAPSARRPPGRGLPQHALVTTGGAAWPLSHEGLRQFWNGGPGISLAFLVTVNRSLAIGLGLDVARFPFDREAFTTAYPGVAVEGNEIVWSTLSVTAKASLLPSYRTCPFLTASVGASRMTEALYRRVIDGARVTYYDVGGTTRLTFAASAGADIYLARWIALEVEGKGWYVHNDPDFGLAGAVRGGIRWSF